MPSTPSKHLDDLPADLDGAMFKVERANHSFNELGTKVSELVRAWWESKPYRLLDEPGPELSEEECAKEITRELEVPIEIPVILGEVYCNLNSALDHLIGVLAARNGLVDSRQYFPIRKDPKEFADAADKLQGIDSNTRDVIKGFKAHFRGDGQLWPLRVLSNFDKHRSITTVVGGSSGLKRMTPLQVPGVWSMNVVTKSPMMEMKVGFKIPRGGPEGPMVSQKLSLGILEPEIWGKGLQPAADFTALAIDKVRKVLRTFA